MNLRPLVLMVLTSFAVVAHADRMPALTDAPPSFKAECGSCHVAFPPALLVADDWRRVMASLDKHYGDNASLDDRTRQTLTDFLVRNAGGSGRSRISAAAGDPPRLTRTAWFERKHDEVPAAVWKDKRIGSAANCASCHSRAEQGSYREREIVLPGGQRWEN